MIVNMLVRLVYFFDPVQISFGIFIGAIAGSLLTWAVL